MAYADYAFYSGTWHGTMPEADFDKWADRASLEIDRVTFDRAADAPDNMSKRLQLCCCALADQLEAVGVAVTLEQAENVDGYSVSWRDGGTPAAMRADRQSVLSGICSDYLTYPENLMYTGVWRP